MSNPNFQDNGALIIKALQSKLLEFQGVDPNNPQSVLDALSKKDKEIQKLKEPPVSIFQLMRTIVSYRGDPLGTFGDKQKKFLILLAKSHPNIVSRSILISKIKINGDTQSARLVNMRGLVRDIRKKFKKFGLSDYIQIVPSYSKKLPGYKLVVSTPH